MEVANVSTSSAFDYVALGNRLRAYRVGASLLAEDVAERLGISRAVVYRLERGEIVKIETLERLAALLETSMASLLGVEVEYYSTALGFFERMRQLEETSDRILAHFEPISLLLTSEDYLPFLRAMLAETSPKGDSKVPSVSEIDKMLEIMQERRALFQKRRPHIVSLIGMRELERFVQTGLVGRVDLPANTRETRKIAARREVGRIADLMESEGYGPPLRVVIGDGQGNPFAPFPCDDDQKLPRASFRRHIRSINLEQGLLWRELLLRQYFVTHHLASF